MNAKGEDSWTLWRGCFRSKLSEKEGICLYLYTEAPLRLTWGSVFTSNCTTEGTPETRGNGWPKTDDHAPETEFPQESHLLGLQIHATHSAGLVRTHHGLLFHSELFKVKPFSSSWHH